jgi:hypothetical protein
MLIFSLVGIVTGHKREFSLCKVALGVKLDQSLNSGGGDKFETGVVYPLETVNHIENVVFGKDFHELLRYVVNDSLGKGVSDHKLTLIHMVVEITSEIRSHQQLSKRSTLDS